MLGLLAAGLALLQAVDATRHGTYGIVGGVMAALGQVRKFGAEIAPP